MTSFVVDVLGRPVLVRAAAGVELDEGLAPDLGFPPRGGAPPALTLDLAREAPSAVSPSALLEPVDDGFALTGPLGRARVDLERGTGLVEPAPGRAGSLLLAVVRHAAARWLLAAGGVMLHAAVVVEDGGAVVLAGPSGSGKSTFAGLAAPRPLLSDEVGALAPDPTGAGPVALRPPPWGHAQRGVEGLDAVPVRALGLLVHGPCEAWRPLSRAQALVRVAQFVPGGPDPVTLVERLDRLLAGVSVGEVLFRRDGDVAGLLRWQERDR